MSVRRTNGKWWVDFRHRFVRHRKKSPLNTRAGAEQYEVTLRAALARGEDIDARPQPAARETTFGEFAAEWFETYVKVNNKPSEQRAKRLMLDNHLLPAFGSLPLDAIEPAAIERYKATAIGRGLHPKSVNNHLAVLRRALNTAREWGRIGGWHALRHTFGTELAARGAPMSAVQKLLGHSTLAMTERYVHVQPSSLSAAIGLLSPEPVADDTGNPRARELTQERAAARERVVGAATQSEKTPLAGRLLGGARGGI